MSRRHISRIRTTISVTSYMNAQYSSKRSYIHGEKSSLAISMATLVFMKVLCILIVYKSPPINMREGTIVILIDKVWYDRMKTCQKVIKIYVRY
jgi:hypothetical protein